MVEVSELAAVVLVSVEEEVEEEEVELDALDVEADVEELADSTELEPSTVILPL